MNEEETERVIAAARDALMRDPERALKLYLKVIQSGVGPRWACAHLEVAEHEYGVGRLVAAEGHAVAILDAPRDRVDPGVRAAAGILWCDIRETVGSEPEESLLRQYIEEAIAHGRKISGAWGLMQLSRRQFRRGERSQSKATILRAADLYDEAGSVNGGPTALQRLAKLELEDGNYDEARRHIDRAIAHLQKFPLGGTLARLLEQRLVSLRDKIPESGQ